MESRQFQLGGMVRNNGVRPRAKESEQIHSDGRPTAEWRKKLRKIPNLGNLFSVVFLYIQSIAILAIVARSNFGVVNIFVYAAAFILMGRTHAQFASLMHESAHRLLFSNKRANDFVGRWLLGYVSFTNTDAYRRVHMAHHRQEFGEFEPDIPLYANYPISRQSFRRKMIRDAFGVTGYRLMKFQMQGLISRDKRTRLSQLKILGVQVVLLFVGLITGNALIYLFFWLLPFLTIWRTMNRLRSIGEHGGLRMDEDRRNTTHSVKQHWPARFFLVPYKIGYHLAHHVDSGIPFRSLPKYHRQLSDSGYVDFEYLNYRTLWRALQAG